MYYILFYNFVPTSLEPSFFGEEEILLLPHSRPSSPSRVILYNFSVFYIYKDDYNIIHRSTNYLIFILSKQDIIGILDEVSLLKVHQNVELIFKVLWIYEHHRGQSLEDTGDATIVVEQSSQRQWCPHGTSQLASYLATNVHIYTLTMYKIPFQLFDLLCQDLSKSY
jgi:hypothetical protein